MLLLTVTPAVASVKPASEIGPDPNVSLSLAVSVTLASGLTAEPRSALTLMTSVSIVSAPAKLSPIPSTFTVTLGLLAPVLVIVSDDDGAPNLIDSSAPPDTRKSPSFSRDTVAVVSAVMSMTRFAVFVLSTIGSRPTNPRLFPSRIYSPELASIVMYSTVS